MHISYLIFELLVDIFWKKIRKHFLGVGGSLISMILDTAINTGKSWSFPGRQFSCLQPILIRGKFSLKLKNEKIFLF